MALWRKRMRGEIPDYDMFRFKDAQEVAEYVEIIFDEMKKAQIDYWIERDYVNNPLSMQISTRDRA